MNDASKFFSMSHDVQAWLNKIRKAASDALPRKFGRIDRIAIVAGIKPGERGALPTQLNIFVDGVGSFYMKPDDIEDDALTFEQLGQFIADMTIKHVRSTQGTA